MCANQGSAYFEDTFKEYGEDVRNHPRQEKDDVQHRKPNCNKHRQAYQRVPAGVLESDPVAAPTGPDGPRAAGRRGQHDIRDVLQPARVDERHETPGGKAERAPARDQHREDSCGPDHQQQVCPPQPAFESRQVFEWSHSLDTVLKKLTNPATIPNMMKMIVK